MSDLCPLSAPKADIALAYRDFMSHALVRRRRRNAAHVQPLKQQESRRQLFANAAIAASRVAMPARVADLRERPRSATRDAIGQRHRGV
jgi:hypothetical protein